MSMVDSRYEIRLPKELKDAYMAAAKRNDRDGAQLIRDFIREYVKKNAQGELLTEQAAAGRTGARSKGKTTK